jgi:ADP-ribose pyrophosphatase
MPDYYIAYRKQTILSPWVTLVERGVACRKAPKEAELRLFHAFDQADYVTLLAETGDGGILLVEQFRPALERNTLEFPGGLLEPGEDPAACAARELEEETGHRVAGPPTLLGSFAADTGRLPNRLWCFHASGVMPIAGWTPEPDVVPRRVDRATLERLIADGAFENAMHMAVLGIALLKGRL